MLLQGSCKEGDVLHFRQACCTGGIPGGSGRTAPPGSLNTKNKVELSLIKG